MPDFDFPAPETGHPNLLKAQETWDAIDRGELNLDELADDIVVDNGPGAGPWRHVEGKEAFFTFVMKFIPYFQGTWHQEGRCIYADKTATISLVHETGTAPSGDVFDNRAIWVSRSRMVVDLVAGSGIEFEDRDEHQLKGVPGTWKLFAVKG